MIGIFINNFVQKYFYLLYCNGLTIYYSVKISLFTSFIRKLLTFILFYKSDN